MAGYLEQLARKRRVIGETGNEDSLFAGEVAKNAGEDSRCDVCAFSLDRQIQAALDVYS